jgi:hypothetical protein
MDSFNIQQGPTAPEVKKLKWKPAGTLLVSEKKRKLLSFDGVENGASVGIGSI